MKGRFSWCIGLTVLLGISSVANLHSDAQFAQSGGVLGQAQRQGPELDPIFAEKRLKAMNMERQRSMVSDADKLLKLARQLDAEIASNPGADLSLEEVRKVGEIEKLAKSVKEKMAQSFTGGPEFRTPLSPLAGPGLE